VSTGTEPPHVRARRDFRFIEDGCQWRAWSTNTLASDNEPFLGVEVAGDGENIYETRILDPAKTSGGRAERILPNMIVVKSGKFPSMHTGFTGALWLGYASHCFFTDLTNGRMPFVTALSPSMFRSDLLYSFTVARNADAIREITFRNDGRYPLVDSLGVLTFKQLKPPFDKGCIESRYIVDEFETTNRWKYPKRYRITYFTAQLGLQALDSPILTRVQVTAHHVALKHNPLEPVTRVTGLSTVYDERMKGRDGAPVSYFTKDFIYRTNTPEFHQATERNR
jgi:hypothetical protein